MAVDFVAPDFDGVDLRIGIVQARFNEDVCHGLLAACLAELKHLGVADEDILHVTVPGALEVPLAGRVRSAARRTRPAGREVIEQGREGRHRDSDRWLTIVHSTPPRVPGQGRPAPSPAGGSSSPDARAGRCAGWS